MLSNETLLQKVTFVFPATFTDLYEEDEQTEKLGQSRLYISFELI